MAPSPEPVAPDRVQVTVTRSGGFAGITRSWQVDSDLLAGEAAAQLFRLVQAALTATPVAPPEGRRLPSAGGGARSGGGMPRGGADAFQYDVVAVVAGRRHRWHGPAAATPAVQQLAEHVRLTAIGDG